VQAQERGEPGTTCGNSADQTESTSGEGRKFCATPRRCPSRGNPRDQTRLDLAGLYRLPHAAATPRFSSVMRRSHSRLGFHFQATPMAGTCRRLCSRVVQACCGRFHIRNAHLSSSEHLSSFDVFPLAYIVCWGLGINRQVKETAAAANP
jgi:hypothetical protein